MSFETERREILGTIELTYNEKIDECEEIFKYFQRLCVMADIAADIFRVEGAQIPYLVSHLTARNYLEMQACILEGAYHSAARSLRWLYEINLIGATACIKPILLDHHFSATKGLTLPEFEEFLENIDEDVIRFGNGKRATIFKQFKLPVNDLMSLYTDLCKYVHLSKISFDKELTFPSLQYISEKFDEVFLFLRRTLDLAFWMQSRMCLCFNGKTAKALKGFLEDSDKLNQYLPITISLISSLK